MKKPLVVVLVEYYAAAVFFSRIAKADTHKDYIFISETPSILLYLASKKLVASNPVFCSSVEASSVSAEDIVDTLKATKPFLLGGFSTDEIWVAATKWVACAKKAAGDQSISYCLVWNGHSVSGVAAKIFKADNQHLKVGYFELSNIPGKIFVDGLGVNARSLLYRCRSILDGESPVLESEWQTWKTAYIQNLSNPEYRPSQVNHSLKLYLKALDFFWSAIFGGRYLRRRGEFTAQLSKLARVKFTQKAQRHSESNVDSSANFVFFPMQVDHDSQLLINSSFGNRQALANILEKEPGLLVIKPHPASPPVSSKWIAGIPEFQAGRVLISQHNTIELVKMSSKVYVINSTVGMEAMILGRSVEFLGRSIFAQFSELQLRNYVLRYLVNIDFFSDSPIDDDGIRSIYERIPVMGAEV